MDEQMNRRRPTGDQKGSGELKTQNNHEKFCIYLNSGPSSILTSDIPMLQHPDNFSWERNFLVELYFLSFISNSAFPIQMVYGLFLPQNAFLN